MNIYDIAKKADVSIATVSRYINKSGYVGKKTAEKIKSVISHVGYTPSAAAKTLSKGGSFKLIGLVCCNIDDLYYAKSVSVLEKRLKIYGYDIILSCTGESIEEKETSINMLLSKNADAIIFIGSVFMDGSGALLKTAAKHVPCFIINALVRGENIYCAYCDDRAAVRETTQKLSERGCRYPMFLYDVETYGSEKKRLGFSDACRNGHIEKISGGFEEISAAFGKLYDEFAPDAVVCSNDVIAAAVLNCAKKLGVPVPEKLKIVGHNNSLISSCTAPSLTSIDNGAEELSSITANNLLKLFNGEKFDAAIKIDYKLIERESF